MKFIRKQKVVDAIQFTGDNWMDVERWSGGECLLYVSPYSKDDNLEYFIEMNTKIGNLLASKGEYIVKNHPLGNYYPIDKVEFEEDYHSI